MRLRVAENGERHLAIVTLSRRNLLALLAKLDLEGSARTIFTDYDCPEGWSLVVKAEDDDEHYAGRAEPPGPMHPATEHLILSGAIRGYDGPLEWLQATPLFQALKGAADAALAKEGS